MCPAAATSPVTHAAVSGRFPEQSCLSLEHALTCLGIWLEYRFARAFGVRPETPLSNRPRQALRGVRAQCWVAVLQTRRGGCLSV